MSVVKDKIKRNEIKDNGKFLEEANKGIETIEKINRGMNKHGNKFNKSNNNR